MNTLVKTLGSVVTLDDLLLSAHIVIVWVLKGEKGLDVKREERMSATHMCLDGKGGGTESYLRYTDWA